MDLHMHGVDFVADAKVQIAVVCNFIVAEDVTIVVN